eukprot:5988195-Lingulodinium_polyedra.AAC.1
MCVAFEQRYTHTRLNRPCAAATAREPHAARTPCEHQTWCSHGARETCGLRAAVAADGRSVV